MTMLNTTILSLDYPDGAEPPNLTTLLQALAVSVETALASAWTTWTPGVAGVTGTSTARYRKVGRTVHYRLECVFSAAPSGNVTFNLPAAPLAPPAGSAPAYGCVHARDVTGGGAFMQGLVVYTGAGSSCQVMLPAASGNTNLVTLNATTPLAWASGDFFSAWGTYEAAA